MTSKHETTIYNGNIDASIYNDESAVSDIKIVSAYSLTTFGSNTVSPVTFSSTHPAAASRRNFSATQNLAPPRLVKALPWNTAMSHRLVVIQLITTGFYSTTDAILFLFNRMTYSMFLPDPQISTFRNCLKTRSDTLPVVQPTP